MLRNIFVSAFLFIVYQANCQSSDFFKVEFDTFSPPEKEMIRYIEGHEAKNFMMKDLHGNDQSLSKYKGFKTILFFWNNTPLCLDLLNRLSEISDLYEKSHILALFNPTQDMLPKLNAFNAQRFHILPNAAFLGEAVYDAELGTPRMYLINENGIVKAVFPERFFDKSEEVFLLVKNFFDNRID